MKRKFKSAKVLIALIAIAGVAVAVEHKEQQTEEVQTVVGNDLGSFKPPAKSKSVLDKLKSLLS